jgi:hypothetical protein
VPGIVPVSHFVRGVLQIGRGDDVIAIEHCARSVHRVPPFPRSRQSAPCSYSAGSKRSREAPFFCFT